MPSLKNNVALITGANHGIGAATAIALSRQGVKVFISYFRPESPYSAEELGSARQAGVGSLALYHAQQQQTADEVLTRIRQEGAEAQALELDLAEAANIPVLFDACEASFGPVDILINNHTHCVLETFDPALIDAESAIILTNAESIDRHFYINARAYALLMSEFTNRFLQRKASWGRIVNISTDAAHEHVANISYAASKHAIESYSRSAARELGKYGITVNIVAPGPIQTGYISPELEVMIAEQTPLGRVGQPEDVADVIAFLVTEQARWLTGQLLYVGGGYRVSQ